MLVSPIRSVKRLQELEPHEVSDLFSAVQMVQSVVEKTSEATSSTVSIQDGPAAGQTVEVRGPYAELKNRVSLVLSFLERVRNLKFSYRPSASETWIKNVF